MSTDMLRRLTNCRLLLLLRKLAGGPTYNYLTIAVWKRPNVSSNVIESDRCSS